MKTRQAREYTGIYNVPQDFHTRQAFLQQLFSPHKLVIFVGLPCTGKTTVLEDYDHFDKHVTKWSREPIFNMIFSNGERDEKYNSYISSLESNMFPSLFQRTSHHVIVDGWNRVRKSRAHFVGLLPKGAGTVMACVFDGPPDQIKERMTGDHRYGRMTKEDRDFWVEHLVDSTAWPKMDEGFDEIVYLNTFGSEGVAHLKTHVTKRK